jgi:hypothetical protein
VEAPLRARDGIAAAVLGLAAAFAIWAGLYTAADAQANPEIYERVHRMSAEAYAADAYWSAALATVPLAIALLTLFDRKRRRLWRRAAFACLLMGLVWGAVGYWEWAATGFDHP